MRRAAAVPARRATAARERAVDAVAAAGLTIFMVVVSGHLHPKAGDRAIGPLAYVLTVAAGAAMVWCRHRPRVAFGVVTVALGCYIGRGYPYGPMLATGWLALLALSLRADRRSALTGGVALCAVLGAAASPKTACASPVTSTTAWRMRWRPSACRRAPRPMWWIAVPRRPRPRSWPSSVPAVRCSTN